jgi:hypothetical protein
MGELLVGGGLLLAAVALETQVGEGGSGDRCVCGTILRWPPTLLQPDRPQLLPDPALADRGDAGQPVAGLHQPVVLAAVDAQRLGAVVDLLHRLDVARLADLALDQIDLGGNLDTARLARPGESFLGLSFEQLAAAGAGRIIPDGKGGARIEAASADCRRRR